MRYNRPKRNKFRSNDRGFRRNDSQDLRIHGINSTSKNFQKTFFGRNGLKAEKLLEKYNGLAREALLNGDKILSESYYQHADHFLRVVENQNLIQNNKKPYLNNSSIEKNSDNKIIIEDEKNSSSQQPQNIEKI
ncbi:MAG: DUF4167 domain-containing protein [Pelagibacteraceae bacterium]|jgi:hypothetical protein|nr:DUF4167 domain-containing protein [Pelagibacteraceae bacterium]|tara:strand:- start:1651 stop:2052 length:402 start_codon:yes stop_codon:yes gene_type:complete